ncbi:MAG: 2-C-methyl-D-erythritol 4-phosphate cytidylyltransferase [Muribaculaceae bacterium]|nr:2-C-methyl-D-erythritol 4-phosphate cytidylyltransferase [Muribaculaceae bacterium]
MKQEHQIFNIIVAAGSGSRFGADIPKQFCLLNGKPVLMHTIERMRQALPKSTIIIVLSNNFIDYWEELCDNYSFKSPQIAIGGDSRWQSVKNALNQIDAEITPNSIITVHDGARPIINNELINRVIDGAKNTSGAIPVTPVTDSLRILKPNGTSTPTDRSLYRAVQTPQAFQANKLIQAYSLPYQSDFTDDASVMVAAGFDDISLVDGDYRNIKITMPHDIDIASIYMNTK